MQTATFYLQQDIQFQAIVDRMVEDPMGCFRLHSCHISLTCGYMWDERSELVHLTQLQH